MEIKLDSKIIITLIVFVVLMMALVFSFIDNNKKSSQLESLKNDYLESEGFYKNKELKLNEAISILDENNKTLKEKLNNVKNNSKIEYLIETKYITNTVVQTLDHIPESYIYYDSNNIPICKFEFKLEKPTFTSLNVDYTLSTIIEEGYSYSILNIKDYEGKTYEILMSKKQLESKVIKIKPKKKILNPKISLGMSINYSDELSLDPVLTLNLIELNPKLNIVSPSILLQSKAIGVSLIDYNLGSKDKLISDSWLGLGVYKNFNKTYYSINISSRF